MCMHIQGKLLSCTLSNMINQIHVHTKYTVHVMYVCSQNATSAQEVSTKECTYCSAHTHTGVDSDYCEAHCERFLQLLCHS